MQSFVTVQPGEVTSCVGCHEPRTAAPANPGRAPCSRPCDRRAESSRSPASPQIVDFRRHIQPILDNTASVPRRERADGGLT